MEMFGNSNGGRGGGGGGGGGGQNGNINNNSNSNNPNLDWDIWNMSNAHNAHHDHSNANNDVMSYMTAATAAVTIAEPPSSASSSHALLHNVSNGSVQVAHQDQHFTSIYGSDHYQHHESRILHGTQYLPDPHLMCLKLGKRRYFEDAPPPPHPFDHRHVAGSPLVIGGVMKRGKSFYGGGGGGGGGSTSSSMKVPRCQVEGCHVALVSAKEYHRRHKVCEMHSKASKVIVLGLEQRFCQQCSRFHVVSEFDESKRSCRRRLAGHNERRRKCSHDSLARGSSQAGRFPYLSSLPTGHSALSLLSSSKSGNDSWVLSPSDFSSRSHAALSELIAENRASIMARQVVSSSSDRPTSNWEDSSHYNNHSTLQDCGESLSQSWPSSSVQSHHRHQQQQMYAADQHSWERFNESGAHLTLELMQQPPSSAYETLLPARDSNAKAEDEECELWKWNSFQGASVV